MIRKPVVAGRFYEGGKEALKREIQSCFKDPLPANKTFVKGVLSPHAGYMYSGHVAAAVLSRIEFPETFVILGPNHTGMGEPCAVFDSGSWETPLGSVEVDEELASNVLESSAVFQSDTAAHQSEHSIEVQLPFLQYLGAGFKIVPVCMSLYAYEELVEAGKGIVAAVKKTGRKVAVLASSDMSHYEPDAEAKKKDGHAIDAILRLMDRRLYDRVKREGISMCGIGPAVAMLNAAWGLGAKSAELVKYATSADVSGDYNSVVGYAGIIIR